MSAPDYSPWRISQRLGTGTLTEAFVAEGPKTPAVLKRLLPFYAENELLSAAFILRGEEMKALEHPAILRVFATGTVGRDRFIVVERAEGRALSRVFSRLEQKEWHALPQIPVVACAYQAAKALAHAHSKGLLHLDVSPHNLYLAPSGHLRICDFGLAHARRSYAPDAGAVELIPPELRTSGKPDPRVDIWQLAASTYMLLAGGLPPNALNRGFAPLTDRVESADETLSALLMRALSPIPAERPLAMAEFVASLGNWLDRVGVTDAAAASQPIYRNVFDDAPPEDGWSTPSVRPWPDAEGTPHKVFAATESTPTSPKAPLPSPQKVRWRRMLIAGAAIFGVTAGFIAATWTTHNHDYPHGEDVVTVVVSPPTPTKAAETPKALDDKRQLPLTTSKLPADIVVSSERHGFFLEGDEGLLIRILHPRSQISVEGFASVYTLGGSEQTARRQRQAIHVEGMFVLMTPPQGMRRLIYLEDSVPLPPDISEVRAGFFTDRIQGRANGFGSVEVRSTHEDGTTEQASFQIGTGVPFHLADDERFSLTGLDPELTYALDVESFDAWHDGLLAVARPSPMTDEIPTIEDAVGAAGQYLLRPGRYLLKRASAVYFSMPRTYGQHEARYRVKVQGPPTYGPHLEEKVAQELLTLEERAALEDGRRHEAARKRLEEEKQLQLGGSAPTGKKYGAEDGP